MARLYDLKAWRHGIQPRMLKKYPLCKVCSSIGKLVPSTVVDHREPFSGNKKLFFDESNLDTLCKSCHDTKTYYETSRSKYLPKGIKPLADEIIILCGAVASGKSTYASKLSDYTVIDLDTIKCDISNQPIYEVNNSYVSRALSIRNRMIENTKGKIIIIATLANSNVRARWQSDLKARLYIMSTTRTECIKRVKADDRRKDKNKHIALIKSFFNQYRPIANEEYVL